MKKLSRKKKKQIAIGVGGIIGLIGFHAIIGKIRNGYSMKRYYGSNFQLPYENEDIKELIQGSTYDNGDVRNDNYEDF